MSHYRVIIPTYQASRHLDQLLPALANQKIDPADIFVIDSSSSDSSVAQLKEFGAEVAVIEQNKFNHGGTRRKAAFHCKNSPIIIFLTQDAIPEPDAFSAIVNAFNDPSVGMAYGRQLPRPAASAIERHARLRNYPEDGAETRQFADRARLGCKVVFSSNSFAAYRTSALEGIGGFPEESFFGEDQITAGKLLIAGWRLAYVSTAAAVHSHPYSVVDDFKRYFDIGVFHGRNAWLLDSFGRAEGEGLKFVQSELSYLAKHAPSDIPSALLRTVLKYVGYRLGRVEKLFSPRFKRMLSMAPYYWRDPN